jgi:hypothetical protein
MATTISGSSGVTFPAGGTDNVAGAGVGTTDTQTLTNKTLSTGLVMDASAVTAQTAVTLTTQTSVNFTSIPSWVKRITVIFSLVSGSGTSNFLLQLGTGAGPTIVTTGYGGTSSTILTASTAATGYTAGVGIGSGNQAAGSFLSGMAVFTNPTGNTWVANGVFTKQDTTQSILTASSITLGAVLTAVRVTTVNGTDTLDSGFVNILYE